MEIRLRDIMETVLVRALRPFILTTALNPLNATFPPFLGPVHFSFANFGRISCRERQLYHVPVPERGRLLRPLRPVAGRGIAACGAAWFPLCSREPSSALLQPLSSGVPAVLDGVG